MNIICISQPGLQRVKNLSQITAGMWQSRAPTSAGIHSRVPCSILSATNLVKSSTHYMIEQGPAGFSLKINATPVEHRERQPFFLYQRVFTLVYPVQPGLSLTPYWIGFGWEIKNKQGWVVPGLPCLQMRQRRNVLAGRTRSHKLPSVLPVQWITNCGIGHCCLYLLRVE